jgi:cytochrome c oxidase subunit 2
MHSVALVPLLTGSLHATNFGSPPGITTQDHQVLRLWHISYYFATPLAIVVVALIVWCIVRYRAKEGRVPAQHQYHIPLEIAYTVVPLVIVAVLFGYVYQAENREDKVSKAPAVKIEVDGFQWGWRFTYNMVTVNGAVKQPKFEEIGSVANEPSINDDNDLPTLYLPANEDVQFNLVSLDVIHSFYIIPTLFKRDLIPGIKNVVDMTFDRSGNFIGECTQFCGTYHPYMRFNVDVMPTAQFNTWAMQQKPGSVHYAGKSSEPGTEPGQFGSAQ